MTPETSKNLTQLEPLTQQSQLDFAWHNANAALQHNPSCDTSPPPDPVVEARRLFNEAFAQATTDGQPIHRMAKLQLDLAFQNICDHSTSLADKLNKVYEDRLNIFREKNVLATDRDPIEAVSTSEGHTVESLQKVLYGYIEWLGNRAAGINTEEVTFCTPCMEKSKQQIDALIAHATTLATRVGGLDAKKRQTNIRAQ